LNNPTLIILPARDDNGAPITRTGHGDSPDFTNDSPHDNPGAGAFVLNVESLSEGGAVGIGVTDATGKYVQAGNRVDLPGEYILAIGDGLGVERASVSAPGTPLPDQFKVWYSVAGEAVFSVKAALI
jgi:hypothetical protein